MFYLEYDCASIYSGLISDEQSYLYLYSSGKFSGNLVCFQGGGHFCRSADSSTIYYHGDDVNEIK